MRVPFAPPYWLTPARIVEVAAPIGITPFVFALAALQLELATKDIPLAREGSYAVIELVIALVVTAFGVTSAAWLVRRALRAASYPALLQRLAPLVTLGAAMAMVGTALIAMVACAVWPDKVGRVFSDCIPALVLDSLIATPPWIVLAIALAIPGAFAFRFRLRASHDGPDRTLALTATWVALLAFTAHAWFDHEYHWFGGADAFALPLDAIFSSSTLAVALLSLVAVLVAYARRAGRARWIHRVWNGKVEGFRIVVREDISSDDLPLLPCSHPLAAGRVLVATWRDTASDQPYRKGDGSNPVAILHG